MIESFKIKNKIISNFMHYMNKIFITMVLASPHIVDFKKCVPQKTLKYKVKFNMDDQVPSC